MMSVLFPSNYDSTLNVSVTLSLFMITDTHGTFNNQYIWYIMESQSFSTTCLTDAHCNYAVNIVRLLIVVY